jgi:hypothetical protein
MILTDTQEKIVAHLLTRPNDNLWFGGHNHGSGVTRSLVNMTEKGLISDRAGYFASRSDLTELAIDSFFARTERRGSFYVRTIEGDYAVFDQCKFFIATNDKEKADRIAKALRALAKKEST